MAIIERDVEGTEGVRLALAEDGRGAPVLLVHGFTGAKEDFTGYLPRFAERGRQAVAFDHRGHGRSDKPGRPEAYSLELLAADTLAVADRLGWDRFALLGHSMGGMVAQLVALAAPERIERLVLMDTAHGGRTRVTDEWLDSIERIVDEGGTAALLAAIAPADPDDPGGSTPAERRLRREQPGYAAWSDQKFLDTDPVAVVTLGRAMLRQADRLPALATLDVPTLVVVGEEDEPFLGPSRAMAGAIPGARLAVLPDGGHCPQFEAPDAWWEAVGSFLAP